jgi:hypothetical protein
VTINPSQQIEEGTSRKRRKHTYIAKSAAPGSHRGTRHTLPPRPEHGAYRPHRQHGKTLGHLPPQRGTRRVAAACRRRQQPIRRARTTPQRSNGRRLPVDECQLRRERKVVRKERNDLKEKKSGTYNARGTIGRNDDSLQYELVQIKRIPNQLRPLQRRTSSISSVTARSTIACDSASKAWTCGEWAEGRKSRSRRVAWLRDSEGNGAGWEGEM